MRFNKIIALALASCLFTGAATQPTLALQPKILVTGHAVVHPTFAFYGIVASVVSVMVDAAYVYNTQCRELTSEEAMMALALPGVGLAINASKPVASKCVKH